MKFVSRIFFVFVLSIFTAHQASAQNARDELYPLTAAPGVSGYEGVKGGAAELVRQRLESLNPAPHIDVDSMGNILATLEGTGPGPHRLFVTPIDEPGYVVSGITPDGYLRLQRLPQQSPQALFDALHFAQPVTILARDGRSIPGVIAGLSVHLQPGRRDAPKMDQLDDIYVDIGASSEAEARRAGVDVLDPLFVDRRLFHLSNSLDAGAAIGDRYGAAALLTVARLLNDRKFPGTVTLAFVTQQWLGSRGLRRLLEEFKADEMIYIGRLPAPRTPGSGVPPAAPGSGVLIATADPSKPLTGFAEELRAMAHEIGISVRSAPAGALRFAASAAAPKIPERFAHLALPLDWPITPIETLSERDLEDLARLLQDRVSGLPVNSDAVYFQLAPTEGPPHVPLPVEEVLKQLSLAYGASGHEAKVRELVQQLLPSWAKPDTDESGNLILHLGTASAATTKTSTGAASAPSLVFVAHMDELGFQVKAISDDGRLQVESLGGGQPQYFFGHPMLLHGDKFTRDAVMELPAGWESPQFIWPTFRGEAPARVDVGARTRAEAEALGIKVGDWITIEKEYHQLAGKRANARSFDDRVGCTALVAAVWALGPTLPNRDVTFIWSTEEEVGLKGAAGAAERMAAAGRAPHTVFAIDTFVSSDSPLENPRFAHALLGQGFVVRAVDNSNIVPRPLVDRVLGIAREHKIPAQYGVTGGGNDGSMFTRFGTADVALGWPLRYSHSPGEVIDTRDVQALADIVVALAKEW